MLTEHEIHAIEHDLTDRVRVLLCADWRSLQAQLAEMTADRDSEQRWAGHYSDQVDGLNKQVAALETVLRDVVRMWGNSPRSTEGSMLIDRAREALSAVKKES